REPRRYAADDYLLEAKNALAQFHDRRPPFRPREEKKASTMEDRQRPPASGEPYLITSLSPLSNDYLVSVEPEPGMRFSCVTHYLYSMMEKNLSGPPNKSNDPVASYHEKPPETIRNQIIGNLRGLK